MNNEELHTIQLEIDSSVEPLSKTNALNKLAWYYWQNGSFALSIDAAQKAFQLAESHILKIPALRALIILANNSIDTHDFSKAEQILLSVIEERGPSEYDEEIFTALNSLGRLKNLQSDYYTAMVHFEQALTIARASALQESIMKALLNLGNTHLRLSNLSKAIDYYTNALVIADEMADSLRASLLLGNIGTTYLLLEDYERAMLYLERSLNTSTELNNTQNMASCFANLGGVHYYLNNFQQSLEYYQHALELYSILNHVSGIANANSNIGLVYYRLKNYSNALKYYSLALQQENVIANSAGIALNTAHLGILFAEEKFELANESKALEYLLQAAAINEELGTKSALADNYEKLSQVYLQMGDGIKAYEHYKKYHDLEREILNEEAKKKAEQLDFERKTVERERALAIERAKHEATEQLLYNVLPPNIAQQMLHGTTTIAEKLRDVSILFADIVDFTQLSQQVSAEELIEDLDKIFSEFDALVEKYGLEKIKTIGDAYMVVSGAPIPRADHSIALCLLALDMQQAISTFSNKFTQAPLQIRIGIHTGEVVAGVIGKRKFAYDLWGDAVNIASRMESSGIASKIQISREVVQNIFQVPMNTSLEQPTSCILNTTPVSIIPRGTIEIKGKGLMETYFIEKLI